MCTACSELCEYAVLNICTVASCAARCRLECRFLPRIPGTGAYPGKDLEDSTAHPPPRRKSFSDDLDTLSQGMSCVARREATWVRSLPLISYISQPYRMLFTLPWIRCCFLLVYDDTFHPVSKSSKQPMNAPSPESVCPRSRHRVLLESSTPQLGSFHPVEYGSHRPTFWSSLLLSPFTDDDVELEGGRCGTKRVGMGSTRRAWRAVPTGFGKGEANGGGKSVLALFLST
ncbi:hypothetical protein B0T20DRAFT_414705 [Sordaria brevicollis]|uniref:Uncharacterized protein n=1 Tax=Sordaria brevicollis TaxID=83679 RepID=A0AAE0UAR9_SORBR|nr:hypothetical protein B0T20DRAFT_414705 [Sordaria brevicollis]